MINIYSSKKFKQTGLWASFIVESKKETILLLKIVGRMLKDHNKKYSSKKEIAEYLDYLYGASLNIYERSYGNYAMMIARLKSINDKYVEKPFLEEQIKFLHEIIYDYDFDQRSFDEAIRLQIDSIKRNNDNPVSYTVNKLLKKCTKDTPSYASYFDDISYLENLKLEDIIDFYRNFLKSAKTEFVMSGDVDYEKSKQLINKYFESKINTYEKASFLIGDVTIEKTETINRKIPQSCLALFYTFNIDVADIKKYNSFLLGCDILGGNPTSLLFQEVREKESLCYSISSSTASVYDGMIIMTSTSAESIDRVKELIDKQLSRMKSGDFVDELLENSRKFRKNSLISIDDSIGGRASYDLDNMLFNSDVSIDELIETINSINKNDVIESFKDIQFRSEVILKGVSND